MYFPFSLKSASNWLDFVPELLSSLPIDSKYVDNKEFHNYLASTLEAFFPEASDQFLLTIFTLLMEATDAGKYVVLQTLLLAEGVGVWEALAQDETFQPLLAGLALSTDKIYAKSAAAFSSKLEEFLIPEAEEAMPELYEKEAEALDEAALDDILEGALEEISSERFRSRAAPEKRAAKRAAPTLSAPHPQPTTAPKPPGSAPASPPTTTIAGPPAPKAAPPAEPSPPPPAAAGFGAPPPAPVPMRTAEPATREEEVLTKRKKADIDMVKSEVVADTPPVPKESPADTMHTHVQYYSRMLSRKTYPLVVTLSRIAKEIAKDKSHFLSGEKEKETRGEFELKDVTKRLVVEPLLSGCLVQPSSQFVDPRSQNLPKVLTFFVTPLVDAGIRATSLTGSVSVKTETGTVLLKLSLPELAVTSHRVSKTATLIGTVGGGAMPALDLLFGVNLQVTLANQLAYINPQLDRAFDMLWVVMGAQVLLFLSAIGIAFLWWYKKSRAKVAPDRSSTLSLT
ncbi:MAG: hypothetical protein ACFFC6_16695 [Promethearchaeota archaeon]